MKTSKLSSWAAFTREHTLPLRVGTVEQNPISWAMPTLFTGDTKEEEEGGTKPDTDAVNRAQTFEMDMYFIVCCLYCYNDFLER